VALDQKKIVSAKKTNFNQSNLSKTKKLKKLKIFLYFLENHGACYRETSDFNLTYKFNCSKCFVFLKSVSIKYFYER